MRRSGIRIMGGLLKLLTPLLHVMLGCITLGTLGYLCAIFIPVLASHLLLSVSGLSPWSLGFGASAAVMIGIALVLLYLALLTAVSLVLFVLENQIPAPVPIPGVKLGLANIITVYAMFALGPKDTLCILLVRVFLGSVFSGQMSTLFYSLSGGLLCYLSMLVLRKILTEKQIWVCGAVGAVAHNIGQILAAMVVFQTAAVAVYVPFLVFSGIITGFLTGMTAQAIVNRLDHRIKTIQFGTEELKNDRERKTSD